MGRESVIVDKAIGRAMNNGWDWQSYWLDVFGRSAQENEHVASIEQSGVVPLLLMINMHPRLIIYSHGFAKALWGEGEVYVGRSRTQVHYELDPWKLRLQEMVTADDPFAYLDEHLDDWRQQVDV